MLNFTYPLPSGPASSSESISSKYCGKDCNTFSLSFLLRGANSNAVFVFTHPNIESYTDELHSFL